jgi:hypothetical protein
MSFSSSDVRAGETPVGAEWNHAAIYESDSFMAVFLLKRKGFHVEEEARYLL